MAKGLKKLKKLPGLAGAGRRRKKTAPDAIGTIPKLRHQERQDDRQAYVEQVVGDRSYAKRLVKLWDEYPAATVPELIAIHWLTKRNIKFFYQLNVRGGRVRQGGIVPDLVVVQEPNCLVWMIQGNYWHTRPSQARADARARQLLLGQQIEGRRVIAVVELWESKLAEDADKVCQSALLGIGVGP